MKLSLASCGLFLIAACCGNAFGQGTLSAALDGYDEVEKQGLVRLASCEEVDFCSTTCPPCNKPKSQFSFGAELPLLTAYANHGVGPNTDLNTTAALRVTATYETAGILGFRGRYFHYDAESDSVPATTLQLDLYDLETTTGLNIADWSIVGAAGLRWGSIDFSSRFGGPIQEFDGMGFTLGADVRRSIARGFSLYAGVRQSMLYGDSTSVGGFGRLDNVVVPITEFRMGTDYTHTLRSGSKIVAGIGYEHQQFSGLSVRNIGINPEDVDIALGGPVFSLGWTF
jgi:hypothetical protein